MRLFINKHPIVTFAMLYLVCATLVTITRTVVNGPRFNDEDCEEQKVTE